MTTQRLLTISCLALVMACGGAAGGPYTPPVTSAGDDGWEMYVDAPTVDRDAARGLDPDPLDSPEAAVVKFLASRVRGDGKWRDAMAVNLSDSAKHSLDEWAEWKLDSFQLRGRKPSGEGRTWVRVHFVLSIGDDTDEGEDEFDVVDLPTLGWRVADPPS